MREVEASAESAKREPEPTEVGDADRASNPAEVVAIKGWFAEGGYPRCGEGCGDTHSRTKLLLEIGSKVVS